MDWTLNSAAWAVGGIWFIFKVWDYIGLVKKWKRTRHVLFSPDAILGNTFPPALSYLAKGGLYPFASKRKEFDQAGWNAFALISPLPSNVAVLWVSDAGIVNQMVNDRALFPKPIERYAGISIYGPNMVNTEGEEWKRHRRVSQPTFSERNNKLVWNATMNAMTELIEEIWAKKAETPVDHILQVTTQVALMVLIVAAFGEEITLKGLLETQTLGIASSAASQHSEQKMSFPDAIYLISTNIVLNIIVPPWLKFITKKTRLLKKAGAALGTHMDNLIQARIATGSGSEMGDGRGDLLSNLVAASTREDKSSNNYLSNMEVRSNLFLYLIAGHETTAHTLAYLFGLLALYPKEQDKLYHQIKEVVGEMEPTFDDFPKFTKVLAAFYETLRMFPPVLLIPKRNSAPVIFKNVTSADPTSIEVKDIFVPAGTSIHIHTPGLHYNERYWPDAHTFKPDRFLEEYNKDAFMPFSGGHRSCIGKRFAEVEATAVTVALLRNYSIHLNPKMEREYDSLNLTVHERTDRLLKSVNLATLTPVDVPLVFKRRV